MTLQLLDTRQDTKRGIKRGINSGNSQRELAYLGQYIHYFMASIASESVNRWSKCRKNIEICIDFGLWFCIYLGVMECTTVGLSRFRIRFSS